MLMLEHDANDSPCGSCVVGAGKKKRVTLNLLTLCATGRLPYPVMQRVRTPLHWAAENGHTEVAKLLLAAGAKVDAVNQVNLMCVLVCLVCVFAIQRA